MEFQDNELISMINDNNDDVKDAIFDKYGYIVDIILNKYNHTIYGLKLDYNEIKQEAMLGFTNALVSYNQNKDSSLPTFISLVVERKILNCVRKATTNKRMMEKGTLSLEKEDENEKDLLDRIGDTKYDPLSQMENNENYNNLVNKINSALSPFEKDVYNLIINGFNYIEISNILKKEPKQIDNTIQRIRRKIKDML